MTTWDNIYISQKKKTTKESTHFGKWLGDDAPENIYTQ